MAHFDREKLAWAAGFFDGEGTITYHVARSKVHGLLNVQPVLVVPQSGITLPDVLKRFQEAIYPIQSRLSGPLTKNNGKLPKWTVRIHNFEGVQAAIAAMWPWLGEVKRANAIITLSAVSCKQLAAQRQGRIHCSHGHELAVVGVKSNGACKGCNASWRKKTRVNSLRASFNDNLQEIR